MFKRLTKDLRIVYTQDSTFKVIPIEEDGFKPNPLDFTYSGYIYKPFDEIERWIEPITFVGNIAKIAFSPTRSFEYIYRYNIYVTVEENGTPNKYVIQNGNVEFIDEHRVPDEP